MALIGNCTHTVYTEHETNTTTETITLEDGTTSTVTVPEVVETSTDYSNIYVCITQIENFNYWTSAGNTKNIVYQFAGYTNAAARDADQTNHLFWQVGQLQSYDHSQNLYAQVYADIKTINGFTNLTDD